MSDPNYVSEWIPFEELLVLLENHPDFKVHTKQSTAWWEPHDAFMGFEDLEHHGVREFFYFALLDFAKYKQVIQYIGDVL